MNTSIPKAAALLLAIGSIGCGGSGDAGLPHVPVTGTVTLDGKPLPNAQVAFAPTGQTKGFGSAARTGPDGKYKLLGLRKGEGAVPGEYKVTINRRLMPDGSEVPENDTRPPIESPARESLPPHYSNLAKTTLTATVPQGGGEINFKLETKKPGR